MGRERYVYHISVYCLSTCRQIFGSNMVQMNDISTVGPGSAIRLILSESWTQLDPTLLTIGETDAMPVGYDVVPLSYRCTRAPGFHPQNSGQSRSRIFCTNLAWDHSMADTIGATGCTICKRCLFARLLEQIQTIWEAKLFGSKTTSLLQRISFETIPNIRESPNEAPGPFVML